MKRGGMNVNPWSLGIWILIEIVHPVLFQGAGGGLLHTSPELQCLKSGQPSTFFAEMNKS